MKWFQVDADTPNDPKIRAVLADMGPSGFGGLVLLWCHIADHGTHKPGWSLDSAGRPMPELELRIASQLTEGEFTRLVTICTEVGHFQKAAWDRRKVIVIPAMSRRADTYTRRRVRTVFAQGSKNFEQSSSTNKHTKHTKQDPPNPPSGGRITKRERRRAEEILKIRFGRCQHEPTCSDREACLENIVAYELRKPKAS